MSGHSSADLGADPGGWISEPPRDEQAEQQKKTNGDGHGAEATSFVPKPWIYRDPTTIQPRKWLLGTTLLRGYATVLASMGGVGKTALAISFALAVITGRQDIAGQHVFQRGRVWLITLEDDREELERRIAAAMIAHGVRPDEVEGKLFINDTTSDRPLLLARADENGDFVTCEDAERVTTGIRDNNILLTVIDPLVKAHHAVENSNDHQDQLIGLVNNIARDTSSAVVLACHFRKGGGEGGARDAIRGGGALIDGARLTRTVIQMDSADAKTFNIKPEDAFRYIRLQDAKANMAPRQTAAWFQLASIPLCNIAVDPVYPAGDSVQAAKSWSPPSPFDGISYTTLRDIFDRLRSEPEPGWFYSMTAQAKFKATDIIIELAGKSRDQATSILKQWMDNDVMTSIAYRTPSGNNGSRIQLNEPKITEILAPMNAQVDT
jgi:hypothetical protein